MPIPSTSLPAASQRKVIRLSKREIEVLGLIGQGYDRKGIAATLCITKKTVSNTQSNIFNKLGVRTRVQAFRAGVRLGLIPIDRSFNNQDDD